MLGGVCVCEYGRVPKQAAVPCDAHLHRQLSLKLWENRRLLGICGFPPLVLLPSLRPGRAECLVPAPLSHISSSRNGTFPPQRGLLANRLGSPLGLQSPTLPGAAQLCE